MVEYINEFQSNVIDIMKFSVIRVDYIHICLFVFIYYTYTWNKYTNVFKLR